MSELLEWIDRFETARDELQDVIRDAHSATKAMKAATAEMEDKRLEVSRQMGEAVSKELTLYVNKCINSMQPELQDYMTQASNRIISEFRKLEQSLFVVNGVDIRDHIDVLRHSAGLPVAAKPTKPTRGKGNNRRTGGPNTR